MGMQLQLRMDKHRANGFTIIESLFVLSIMLVFTTLAIPVFRKPNLDFPYYEIINIYDIQTQAIISKEKKEYDGRVTFNPKGNINHASTISHDHYSIVFQLGCGRFYVR